MTHTWWNWHAKSETGYTPFTQGLRPLCLPCATTKLARSPLKAEGRPNGCLGHSRVAHRTFTYRHGRHGHREVLSMFKTVAQRSLRRSVANRSLKGGRMQAHTSPWSQNGCTVVGPWSPSKKCDHCVSIWATRLPPLYHHCASFGRPMASIEWLLRRPLCLHSATTATLEPPWQWFCLHSAFFARPVVPIQQFWSFKEGTRVVLQQLHRNRTFWVPATTERPNHFYGRTKVARRWQPCVKEALLKHNIQMMRRKPQNYYLQGITEISMSKPIFITKIFHVYFYWTNGINILLMISFVRLWHSLNNAYMALMFFSGTYTVQGFVWNFNNAITSNASVTSHSRAPYGLFPGCFEQKSYMHSRGGTNFASPYRARRVLMHAL